MTTKNATFTLFSACAAAFVLAGCPAAEEPAADTAGTGGTSMTGAMTANMTQSPDPDDSADDSPMPGTDDGTTGGSMTTGGMSDTTGAMADCVDQNIGMAVGQGVATGDSNGEGDDFDWTACGGGFGTAGDVGSGGFDSGGFDSGGFDTGGFVGSGGFTSGGFDSGGFVDSGGFDTGGKRGPGDDFVVQWTPPSTGSFVVSLQDSAFDTVLTISPPACGADSIVCNDDCTDLQSGLVYDAVMGETVFIVIDGYAGNVGNFTLDITEGSDRMCLSGGDTFGTDAGGEAGGG